MFSRRHVLLMSVAACVARPAWGQDRYDQAALLAFPTTGNVTLLHLSDIAGEMTPAYFRAAGPSFASTGTELLSGEALRVRYGIGGRTHMAYALTHEHFAEEARAYGKMGGLPHIATAVEAVRAARPEALVLVSGHSVVGSQACQAQMGQALADLQADAVTVGDALGNRNAEKANLLHKEKNARILTSDGVKIVVIGHFEAGVTDLERDDASLQNSPEALQMQIEKARFGGAELVVVLSQQGLSADRQMARDVRGIDVLLSGGSHMALPEPIVVGQTRVVASGGQGQFLGRIDLEVQDGRVQAMRHRLIPIFADLLNPDPDMDQLVSGFETPPAVVLGRAGAVLYRRGPLTSSWDRVICAALMADQAVDIALVSGVRWGQSVLPGDPITDTHITSLTRGMPDRIQRRDMTGETIAALLEDAAEDAFSQSLSKRTGLDMMRAGGLAFEVAADQPKGRRIGTIVTEKDGKPLKPDKVYTVATWLGPDHNAVGADAKEILTRFVGRLERVLPPPSLVTWAKG